MSSGAPPSAPFAGLLQPGETVLWSAQPTPGVYMMRGLPAVFYGATWAVLGAFWYQGSGGIGRYSAFEGGWRLIPLGSVPFILAGLSFFFFPMSLGARARRTWYVVTDRRFFQAELRRSGTPRLLAYDHAVAPLVRPRWDRRSDLILTRRAQEQLPHLPPRLEDGFFGLTDPAPALQAIERSRPASSSAGA
jgi:hypothetical protein